MEKEQPALLRGGFADTTWAAIKKDLDILNLQSQKHKYSKTFEKWSGKLPDHLQFGGIKVPGPDWIVLKAWVLTRGTTAQRSEWQVWFTFRETPVFQLWYKDSHISHQQTVSVSLPQRVPGTEDRILITFGS